jgi:hypothetical protein
MVRKSSLTARSSRNLPKSVGPPSVRMRRPPVTSVASVTRSAARSGSRSASARTLMCAGAVASRFAPAAVVAMSTGPPSVNAGRRRSTSPEAVTMIVSGRAAARSAARSAAKSARASGNAASAVQMLSGSFRSVPAPTMTASATARRSARTKRSPENPPLTSRARSWPATAYETMPSIVLTKFANTCVPASGKRSGPP